MFNVLRFFFWLTRDVSLLLCTQLTSASSKRTQSTTSQAMRCRLLETRRMTLKIRTLTSELKRIQIVKTKTQYARRVPPLRSGTGSRGLIQEKRKREQKKHVREKIKLCISRGRIREQNTLRQLSGNRGGGKTKLLRLLRRTKQTY